MGENWRIFKAIPRQLLHVVHLDDRRLEIVIDISKVDWESYIKAAVARELY